jgi:hypothetical protein
MIQTRELHSLWEFTHVHLAMLSVDFRGFTPPQTNAQVTGHYYEFLPHPFKFIV